MSNTNKNNMEQPFTSDMAIRAAQRARHRARKNEIAKLEKELEAMGPSYDEQEHRAEMGHGFIGKDGGPVN